MCISTSPMTVVRARMLSEALSQYIANANLYDDQSLTERTNIVIAQAMLDEADAFLASAAE